MAPFCFYICMTSNLLPQASSPTLQILRPKSIPTPFISLIWVPSHPLFQSMTSFCRKSHFLESHIISQEVKFQRKKHLPRSHGFLGSPISWEVAITKKFALPGNHMSTFSWKSNFPGSQISSTVIRQPTSEGE